MLIVMLMSLLGVDIGTEPMVSAGASPLVTDVVSQAHCV